MEGGGRLKGLFLRISLISVDDLNLDGWTASGNLSILLE